MYPIPRLWDRYRETEEPNTCMFFFSLTVQMISFLGDTYICPLQLKIGLLAHYYTDSCTFQLHASLLILRLENYPGLFLGNDLNLELRLLLSYINFSTILAGPCRTDTTITIAIPRSNTKWYTAPIQLVSVYTIVL